MTEPSGASAALIEVKDSKEVIRHRAEQEIFSNDDREGREGCCGCVFRYIFYFFGFLLALIPLSWPWCIKVCDQYERLVHFRLGRAYRNAKGPGLFFFIPCVDSVMRVDMRVHALHVDPQEMMTKDSVTCHVNAVIYFRVVNAVRACCVVEDYHASTSLFSQTTLRSVIGESELDELLQKREVINKKLQLIIESTADEWGIEITAVEVKDVTLPTSMQRAMASQAEAERERRAKVIAAKGEQQSADMLLQASNLIAQNPTCIQLRYLQTLGQIATEKNSTIVFPLPMDLMGAFGKAASHAAPLVQALASAASSSSASSGVAGL